MRILLSCAIIFSIIGTHTYVYADTVPTVTSVTTSTTSLGMSTDVITVTNNASNTVVNTIASTVYKDFKLKVPSYKQQYENSCEASSLRMALEYKGIRKNDIQILMKFKYNPRPKDWVKNIWDDPQKQFVGYVDVGGKPNGGYGVYGMPVLRAIEGFGRAGVYATGTMITATFLATELDAKNPILIWGYTSLREPVYTWTTPEGRVVTAVRGEHVRVVVGYKGTAAKPIGFYVHDSYTGKANEYWPAQKLIDHIQKVPGVTDQAVVVR